MDAWGHREVSRCAHAADLRCHGAGARRRCRGTVKVSLNAPPAVVVNEATFVLPKSTLPSLCAGNVFPVIVTFAVRTPFEAESFTVARSRAQMHTR